MPILSTKPAGRSTSRRNSQVPAHSNASASRKNGFTDARSSLSASCFYSGQVVSAQGGGAGVALGPLGVGCTQSLKISRLRRNSGLLVGKSIPNGLEVGRQDRRRRSRKPD